VEAIDVAVALDLGGGIAGGVAGVDERGAKRIGTHVRTGVVQCILTALVDLETTGGSVEVYNTVRRCFGDRRLERRGGGIASFDGERAARVDHARAVDGVAHR